MMQASASVGIQQLENQSLMQSSARFPPGAAGIDLAIQSVADRACLGFSSEDSSSMNRSMSSLAAFATVLLAQGCATPHPTQAALPAQAASLRPGVGSNSCVGPRCAAEVLRVAHRTEVPVEKDAPNMPGHPLTSVVITQCNLIVAVYMTMADGSLLRFDSGASVPADQLLQMAYTATRSERVEVSCNDDSGAVSYEKHDPV
jgi:hypothetical protein